MHNPRNIQDVIPSGFGIGLCQRRGRHLAEQIGYTRGSPVMKVLEGFKGEYINVPSTFGLGGDVYLVKPGAILVAEHEPWASLEWHANTLNEILAEGLGHKFLHYPLVVEKFGPDAGMGVRRHSQTEADHQARREATHFMIGFLAPDEEIIDACREGLDDVAIGKRFGITQRLAAARRKAMTDRIHRIPHTPV